MRRLISLLLVIGVVFMSQPAFASTPEALSKADIRGDVIQNSPEVDKFLQDAGQILNKQMSEAIKSKKISPSDPEGIRAEMRKAIKKILVKATEVRKELKEPEHRLKLDMNLLQLAVQASDTDTAMNLMKNWKGEARAMMAMTIASGLQRTKTEFPATLVDELTKLVKGKNKEFATAAKKMLNPFFRNPVGKVFPDFPEGKKTIDGKDLTLSRFKGKVLLVDFWATWCGPCRAEVPNVVEAYEKYKDKGFEIVGISFDKDRSKLDGFIKEHKMTWPQYFDGKGWANEVGATYNISSIPSMYLLDKDGKVITTDLRQGKLEKELEKLLK